MALKIRYLRSRRSFQVSGTGWTRVVSEEFFREVVADGSTMVNRILCEGSAA